MGKPTLIRVLIADDHSIIHKGIAAALEDFEHIEVVGGAKDGAEAIQACHRFQPDVLLIDLRMPEMDGITAIQYISRMYPQIAVVVFTAYDKADDIEAALRAGAINYMFKDISIEALVAVIQDAYRLPSRRPVEIPERSSRIVNSTQIQAVQLTQREREILMLLREGKSNKEIAQQLTVSIATVKKHISIVLGKLGAVNRTQAVVVAIQRNLI